MNEHWPYIPQEADIRRWVKEAVKECFQAPLLSPELPEPLLSRKETAGMFKISLVTLNDWTKKGLPYHKQRRKVYYLRSEVLAFMKKKWPNR